MSIADASQCCVSIGSALNGDGADVGERGGSVAAPISRPRSQLFAISTMAVTYGNPRDEVDHTWS